MTKNNARVFLKNHLRRRGDEPVVVTEQLVRKWWHILNAAVFNGHLNKSLSVTTKKLRKVWAWAQPSCIKGRLHIIISSEFSNRRLFLSTLIHEMVHAWELQHFGKLGHGKRFFSWESRIKWTTNLSLAKTL
jgi:hypothetical protein